MQDFSVLDRRRVTRPGAIALLAILALLSVAVPTSGQAINESANGTENGTPTTDGEVVSCQQVRENPQGDPSAPYRIVKGSCSVSIEDGEILSRVWFQADGGAVSIDASGSGWTIRNIAVTNHSASEDPPLHLTVESRDGLGVVSNLWASGLSSNVLFVHPRHRGAIRFRGVTAVDVAEDFGYASRPGNPPSITENDPKIEGNEGTVGFRQVYLRDIGFGPEVGYGVRLGSDGSYLINSTLVNVGGPAVANTFASGQNPKRHSETFAGVVVRNVDIIQPSGAGPGVRLNNHQDSLKPKREWTAITTFENVDIEASEPIERHRAGGEDPIVRGSYGSDADPTPPPLAPRSPVRAASGVGGGTGGIGGPIGGFPVTQIASIASLLVLAVVLAIVVAALGIIALIESDRGGV